MEKTMIKRIAFASICLVMLIVSTILYCKYDDVLWWRILIAYSVFGFSSLLFLKEELALRISFMFRLRKYEKKRDFAENSRFFDVFLIM